MSVLVISECVSYLFFKTSYELKKAATAPRHGWQMPGVMPQEPGTRLGTDSSNSEGGNTAKPLK